MYIEPMKDEKSKQFFKGYNSKLRKSVEIMDKKFTHFSLLPDEKKKNYAGYDYDLTNDDHEMLNNLHPYQVVHSHIFKNTKLKDNLLGYINK